MRQNKITLLLPVLTMGGSVNRFAREFRAKHRGPVLRVKGVVKMSRTHDRGLYDETYWTETVDVSARAPDGKNLFHSFHVLAVPDGEIESLQRARMRFRESLMARLVEAVEKLSPDGYPAN